MLTKILETSYDRVYFADEYRKQINLNIKRGLQGSSHIGLKKLLVSKPIQEPVAEGGELLMGRHAPDKGRKLKMSERIVQFFGLPSGDEPNVVAILKGLSGWNKTYSVSRNVLQALVIFPVNLILSTLKLALNLVKLVTEFLPLVLAKLCIEGCLALLERCKSTFGDAVELLGKNLNKGMPDASPGPVAFAFLALVFYGLCLLIVGAITVVSHITYFVGCAATSPADTFRAAYMTGLELVGDNSGGRLLGGCFAFVSLCATVCVYVVFFPLAIKLLITQAPTVLPAIANGISSFVGLFGAQAGASVATFFTTTLPTFLSSFGTVLATTFSTTLGATPVLAGVAAITAIGVGGLTPATVVIDRLGEEDPMFDWPAGAPETKEGSGFLLQNSPLYGDPPAYSSGDPRTTETELKATGGASYTGRKEKTKTKKVTEAGGSGPRIADEVDPKTLMVVDAEGERGKGDTEGDPKVKGTGTFTPPLLDY